MPVDRFTEAELIEAIEAYMDRYPERFAPRMPRPASEKPEDGKEPPAAPTLAPTPSAPS